MRILLSAASALLLLGAPSTWAQTVAIGGAKIELTVPAGFCQLDMNQPSDAKLKSFVQSLIDGGGTNLFLGQTVDCRQLKDWRNGKEPTLNDFAQFQTMKALVDKELPMPSQAVIAQTCKELRAAGEQLTADALTATQPRVEAASKNIRLNEMKFIGVLDEDTSTCYAAMLQRLRTDSGAEKTQLCLFSVNVVRGKIVYYYLFTPFAAGDDTTAVIARHKTNTVAFQLANK